MRILHLGDLHLGKSLGDFDLIDDQKYILNQIIEMAVEKKADAIVVAGDVYDKAIPSEAAVNLLDYFISTLAKKKIKVFIISGNHDSDDRLNFGSNVFESNHIYISAKYDGTIACKSFEDEYGEICFYLLPYVKASHVKRYFPQAKINCYDDAVRTLMENTKIDTTKRNVLIAHQFVTGEGSDPTLAGSEGVAAQSVGLVEKIAYSNFDMFDYVALGHIHSGQQIGREKIRYSGSPLKYSLSEVNHKKTVPMITFGEKGNTEIELVPLKPMRDMRHIKGKIETLLDKKNMDSCNDFMYVTLTDDDIIPNAMNIFQQYYPYTVKIDYDNAYTREVQQVDISQVAKQMSFTEFISDFYKMMYSQEISEEELAMMEEIAQEVGVLDETN